MAVIGDAGVGGRSEQHEGTAPSKTPITPKFGRDDFRFTVTMPGGGSDAFDDCVESCSWTDPSDGIITTADLTIRNPVKLPNKPSIVSGAMVTCLWRPSPSGSFRKLWTKRVYDPTLALETFQRSVQLKNEAARLEASEDDFKFKKGMTQDAIIKQVCTRYSVPFVSIAPMTFKLKKIEMPTDTTPMTVINDALQRERDNTGNRFLVAWRSDESGEGLYIAPFNLSGSDLYALGPAIITAALQESMRENFASAVKVTAIPETSTKKDEKGHRAVKTKVITKQVPLPPSIARFGFVHRNVFAHHCESEAEATTMATNYLRWMAKPNRTLTLNHPGVPTIRRGDMVRLVLSRWGLTQDVWVTEVTHSVDAANYTMDVTLSFENPFVPDPNALITETNEEVANETGRVAATSTPATKTAPVPPRAIPRATTDPRLDGHITSRSGRT